MYLCTPITNEDCSTISSGTEGLRDIRFISTATQDVGSGSDSVTVVHLDLDGGEEPAVTTDVMFSGMLIKTLLL
jgi:hypothetical protein